MAQASVDAALSKVKSGKKETKLKICLLGPTESGKSEFVKCLIKGNPNKLICVSDCFFVHGLRLDYAPAVIFDVTECRGNIRSQLQQASKHKPDVYFLLFDVNSKTSLYKMKNSWLNDLYDRDTVTITIGNKSDLPSNTQHARFPGVLDKGWLSGHMEISSITGQNIDRLVQRTVEIFTGLDVQGQIPQVTRAMTACSLSSQPPTRPCNEYKMDTSPKGVCLILSMRSFPDDSKYRYGAEQDEVSLEELFSQFGFEVEIETDLGCIKLLTTLKSMASLDHSQYSCFVCAVMSHGSSQAIKAADGLDVTVDQITKQFTAEQCPSLRGKPKVFLFQSCRGLGGQQFHLHETDSCYGDMEDDATVPVPNEADFLIARSTVDGYASYRDTKKGSYFISNLVEILRANPEHSLVACLTLLNERVADLQFSGDTCQMPCFHTTLRKDLVLGR
ncbi:caspase-3-like [Haliotis rubra]|uniref:caspase-3-like n=1 Tax=Haliotis rubra TaxID=36100 RepID=UPI001EE55392|nr:caspase-3-like [Haliotis rubra]